MASTYNLVFSDGTGQRGVPDVNGIPRAGATNIYKMYLAARMVPSQNSFYDAGLGSDPQVLLDWVTWSKNLVSKATGLGITRNIRECYEFLLINDVPDCRIGLFGFSRGAYTARSLGGLLGLCGIPAGTQAGVNIRGTSKAEIALRAKIIEEAIGIYQTYGADKKEERKQRGAAFRDRYASREAVPHVIGVFDTVASLGLPGVTNLFNPLKHAFHDAELNPKVPFGFQALAVDEDRKVFRPEIWDQRKFAAGQNIEQVWFPGAHSDIGGGYENAELSDLTLSWMCAKCTQPGIGLDLPLAVIPKPSITGRQHSERTGWGVLWSELNRGEYVRKHSVAVDPLADPIEHRFNTPALNYRPLALRGHPRVSGFY
jgi:uncharacterized protein (DUF2235 family)